MEDKTGGGVSQAEGFPIFLGKVPVCVLDLFRKRHGPPPSFSAWWEKKIRWARRGLYKAPASQRALKGVQLSRPGPSLHLFMRFTQGRLEPVRSDFRNRRFKPEKCGRPLSLPGKTRV